jgi:nucleoside recognition membrane protein YjiH
VLLAAHFVGVLCVVLRDFRKIWIHIISIQMFIWIHICRTRTAYLWQITWIVLRDVFLASIFLAYVEPKLFFSLSRGKIVWRQMVRRSTHAVRKIRSIRNCTYGTYVGKQSSAQHRGRRAQKVQV